MTIQTSNLAASKMNLQSGDAALATLSAGRVTVVAYPTTMSADKESSTRRPNAAGAIGEAATIRSDVDGVSAGSLALRRSAPITDRSQTSSLRLQVSGSASRKLPPPAAAAAGPVPDAKTPNMQTILFPFFWDTRM